MRRSPTAFLPALVVVLLFAPAVLGVPPQESMPQLQRRDSIKVTTRLVTVNVVATDKKGRSITDLKQEDFILLEDGKEQKISVFQLQQPPSPSMRTVAPTDQLPPNVFTNASQFQPSEPRSVILLDTCMTSVFNQSFARSEIIKYVTKMPVDEPLAIFELSCRGIRMAQDFTTDRTLLLQAAKSLRPKLSAIQQLGPYQAQWAIQFSPQALEDFAATLAACPGRKNLIWISDRYTGPHHDDPFLVSGTFDAPLTDNPHTSKTIKAMIDSQVAIYPVDAAGLPGLPEQFSAAWDGGAPGTFALFGDYPTDHAWEEKLATETGGKAYYNRNDVDHAIGDSINDGSTYYLLGYYPDNKNWNGTFRNIQVKVNRTDVKLRHRLGYIAVDPEQYSKKPSDLQLADLHRALRLSTPLQTAITFNAEVRPPWSQTKDDRSKVSVQFAIATQGLDFQHGDDNLEHASIDCVAQAYTEKGTVVQASSNTYEASLEPRLFKLFSVRGFPCVQDLNLHAGNYLLKLAVRDNRTGAIGTVNAKVHVPLNRASSRPEIDPLRLSRNK